MTRTFRPPSRAASIWLIVLAYTAFVALKLVLAHGDPSTFVVAGDRFFDRTKLEAPVSVLPHSDGYDGQFVYRLALDPFTHRRTDYGITIDTPALRAQRIGYPLLAYLVSLGSPRWVAASLVLVNLAALALLAWASTGIALLYRRPAWQGLVIALYPGMLLSLARDTTEIVSTALAVSAVRLALGRRPWVAAFVACAAVLTRETTLLYLFGFGAVAMGRMMARRRPDARVAAFLLPVVTIIAWQVMLVATWHTTSFADVGSHDLALPPLRYFIIALAGQIAALAAPAFGFSRICALVATIFPVAHIAIVVAALRRTSVVDWRLALPWGAYLVLASLFTNAVWAEPFGYVRIFVDLYATGCLLLLAAPGDRALRLLFKIVCVLWPLTWGYA